MENQHEHSQPSQEKENVRGMAFGSKNFAQQQDGLSLPPPPLSFISSGQMPVQRDRTEERRWYEEHPEGRSRRVGGRLILWNFPIEGAEITSNQRTVLANFLNPSGLTWLAAGTRIEIIGRASNSGESDDNLVLSRQRAEVVAAACRQIMAPRSPRMDIIGYGISTPLQSNDTPEGMAMNRSAEIEIHSPRPRAVPDRDNKWAYAKRVLEQRLNASFPGNADQIWTPTSTGMVRIMPRMPLGPEPEHYGDSVPQELGNQRPSSRYMPQPHRETIRTLGGMLTREFRLNQNLSNRQIERVVIGFIDDARQANQTRLRRLRVLEFQASQGGGSLIGRDLDRYRAAERQYFVNDPFCIFRHMM